MIGFYDYTVILTYLGFSSGMIGIFLAITGNTFWSVMCLMFSGLCDMFDGRVARTKKKRTNEERHFGIQLDSLSDLVCFGVLPAIIGYSLGIKNTYLIPLIIIYPLAALIRLAYFNVLEITRNSSTPVKEYTGLPVTSSALIFPFLYIFRKFLGKYFVLIYGIVLFVIAILFISKIKIKKPGIRVMIGFIIVGVIEILLILAGKFL
ncbi:MAG: CDP-alcohol phosphatidyltransferase family protein [Bacilli bacterium]|nr:CDP-alcohol phosphatidyltransferase family protein [Bacilli bacterium]